MRALFVLCYFPEIWNSLVIVVSNYVSSSNKIKIDDVIGVIISEEMRRKSTGESSASGNALTVENRGRTKERGKIPINHGKSQGKSNKGRSKSKGKMDCWHYGKTRNLKKDCWS